MNYINPNGNPVPAGYCVTPDHFELEFTVKIRSMRRISEDTVKDIIQTKFEVVDCQFNEKNSICFVVPH